MIKAYPKTQNSAIEKSNSNSSVGRIATKHIAYVAIMASMLTAMKFALSFIPNVEVVTLLILVFSSMFGLKYSLPAVLIFCGVEVALYGVNSWVVLYLTYYPLLAIISGLLLRKKKTVVAVLIAGIMSLFFGVLDTCIQVLFYTSGLNNEMLAEYWVIYYVRGAYFHIALVVSNIVIVGLLYKPLKIIVERLNLNSGKNAMINNNVILNSEDVPIKESYVFGKANIVDSQIKCLAIKEETQEKVIFHKKDELLQNEAVKEMSVLESINNTDCAK